MLPPEVYRDPGAWSREEYLLDLGITSTATLDSERVERLSAAPSNWFGRRAAVESLHCRLSEAQRTASNRLLALPAATSGLPKAVRINDEDAIMLAAMVTGDRTFLSHSLRVGFERTGSFHMLVVSGFHLAIMAGCIFWIAKLLRLPRVSATLITIAASFAYALFTGFAVPVQRSLWMVTLYLIGRLLYRERNPVNTIGFAALCLLVASPRALFDSGFQMTLLAVVSIGGIATPLLQSTIHPYLSATRDLDQVAIDMKLPPLQAQFRVILRMIAGKLEAAFHRVIARQRVPPAGAIRAACLRTGGRSLRRGTGDDVAHGHLLPSHHPLCAAGESADPAAAAGADAGGGHYVNCASGVAGRGGGAGCGGRGAAAFWGEAGAPIRINGARRFPDSGAADRANQRHFVPCLGWRLFWRAEGNGSGAARGLRWLRLRWRQFCPGRCNIRATPCWWRRSMSAREIRCC